MPRADREADREWPESQSPHDPHATTAPWTSAASAIETQRRSDPRVDAIRSLVDSGRYDLLSLDVFDTLVWRRVPAPPDVHFLTARSLLANGRLHDSSSPESFSRERMGAEERARRKRPPGEVTLAEIYDEFPIGYLRGSTREDAVTAEIEAECSVVRLDAEMAALLAHARDRGLKTAIVSDTYFERDQIARLLPPEILATIDHVILSCEHRVSKYLGLHRVLLEATGVAPERVLHVGDNYDADVEGPAALGLERYWYRKFPQAYEEMMRAELPLSASRRSALFAAGDDCGMTALRSRALARHTDPYEQWGAAILGPVVNGFCDWVTEKCDALAIDTVLCLMREGRIFKLLLDTRGSGLVTRELFVSRYAALKASIYDGTEDEIKRFVFRPTPQPAARLLEQIGLAQAGIAEASRAEPLEPREALALIKRIARDPSLRKLVSASSATARGRFLAHLRRLVDPRPRRSVAFVDLGYKGTIQECVQLIMNREGFGMTTHGLYLVTGGDVHTTQSRGAIVEGWLAENGQPTSMAHTFMRSPEIVEQSLMAPCGTTLGHDAAGEPILDQIRIPPGQQEQIEKIQTGLLSFADLWVRHGGGRQDGCRPSAARMKPWYQEICARMVARPSATELDLFGEWQHDENFGSTRARRLATVLDLDEWEYSHMSAHQLASLPFARVYWPFGFARRISPQMAEAVAHIYLRTAEPDVFEEAGPPHPIVFYWDQGSGFNQDAARMDSYRLNNRGRVWKRFTLDLKGGRLRSVAFSVGLPGEFLRLAGCLVRLLPEGGPETIARHPHEFIDKLGYARVAGNLYAVEEDPALLVVPVACPDGFTGRVLADLFFGLVSAA